MCGGGLGYGPRTTEQSPYRRRSAACQLPLSATGIIASATSGLGARLEGSLPTATPGAPSLAACPTIVQAQVPAGGVRRPRLNAGCLRMACRLGAARMAAQWQWHRQPQAAARLAAAAADSGDSRGRRRHLPVPPSRHRPLAPTWYSPALPCWYHPDSREGTFLQVT